MLVYMLVVLGITFIIDLIIRQKLNIDFEIGLYRPVNNTHKWLENILILLLVIGVIIVALIFTYKEIFIYFFGFSTILLSVRTYMEYKHGIKEEKQHVSSFVYMVGCLVIFIGSLFFIT